MLSTNSKILFIALIAVFTGSLGISSGHFENPDAHLRLSQSFSIAENGSFQLRDGVGNPQHGNIAINEKGERYSVYSPGQIILFTPAAILSQKLDKPGNLHPHYTAELINSFLGVAIHFLTSISVFLAATAIGRSRAEAIILGIVFSLCTFNLPSSRDGYEHAYEAFFILMSYAVAWIAEKRGSKNQGGGFRCSYFYAGLLLGLGILFRPTAILALPGLLIICWKRSNITHAILGLSIGVGIFGIYNQLRFGSPIETGYLQAWLAANPELVGSPGFSIEKILPQALALWVSPGKGMLLFSPILLAAILIQRSVWKERSRVVLTIVVTASVYTVFYAANFAWHGSAWSWGPRYLIPITPLLILLVPKPTWSTLWGRSTVVLIFVSALVQVGALLVNYKRHLLQVFSVDPEAFEDGRIFFDPSLSPLVSIPENITYLFQRLKSSDLIFKFISPGPWKNEARPVDIRTMLDASVDMNTFDFWWIRILYYPFSDSTKQICLLLGLTALCCFILAVRRLVVSTRP